MMDPNLKAILDSLQGRKGRPGFGYGLGTAEGHVKRFIASAGQDALRQTGIIDEKSGVAVVKRAAETLTWCDDSMVVEEKLTNSTDFRTVMPSGVDLPKNTLMVIRHVLTTDRKDRDEDILRTGGGSLDPKSPLLWQHMHAMPIGGVLAEVEHTDNKLTVVSAILDMPGAMGEIVKDAATLVEANMLRFSHGFRVLEFDELEKSGDGGWPGFDIKRFEIMEASLVSVPSNVDAEIEMIASTSFKSAFFRSIQKDVQSQRPVQVRGVEMPGQLKLRFDGHTIERSSDGGLDIAIADKSIAVEPEEIVKQEEPVEETKSVEPATLLDRVKSVLADMESDSEDVEPAFDELSKWVGARDGKVELTKSSAIAFIIGCGNAEDLKTIRDFAAAQIELCEQNELAEQYQTLVSA